MCAQKVHSSHLQKRQLLVSLIPAAIFALISILVLVISIFNTSFALSLSSTLMYSPAFVIVFVIFLISAVLATYSSIFGKSQLHYITKPLTTTMCVLIAFLGLGNYDSSFVFLWLIIAGLVLSLFGDIFLMFMEHKKYFTIGLSSFLCGHIAYAIAFLYANPSFDIQSFVLAVPAVIFAIFMYKVLSKKLKDERLSILAYMCIISFMVWRSYVLASGLSLGLGIALALGSTCFFISDSIIAYERFRNHIKYGEFGVLALYFSAQVLIANVAMVGIM